MSRSMTIGKVIQLFEEWVPKKLASDWDNVGLQIGSLTTPVKNILVTLDVTELTIDEAIENEVNLIISHHPLLFKSLKSIDYNDPQGKLIQQIIKNDLSVYSAHTNLDIAPGGVNDLLAEKLSLQNIEILVPQREESFYKLLINVPESHLENVNQALTDVGVGRLGDYRDCSFRVKGTGTFTPTSEADPYIGEKNKQEFVDEVRIDYLLPKTLITKAIDALLEAHPYEEPAYDLIELKNQGEIFGLGRIGVLPKELTLKELALQLKEFFKLEGLRVTGSLDKKVSKVAVLGGSGEKYYHYAQRQNADVYITGDVTFHQAQDAEQAGLSIIDPGHHIEAIMIEAVANYLRENVPNKTEVIQTEFSTEPFKFL